MRFTMDDLSTLTRGAGSKEKTFSCCEVLRRRKRGRALLVAHGVVYDATLFLADHPVGPLPILRGLARDNTEDMQMHSAAAQRAWGKLKIGVLRKCPNRAFGPFVSPKGKYEACVVS
jgi:cytochrome b involved in lipid metabolism